MIETKKALMVYNSHSGKARLKNNLCEIVDILSKAGYELTLIPTQYQGHAREAIEKDGARYDLLVASGGDGTLKECVTGLVSIPKSERPVLGYIPAGSTNDFARSLGIPRTMVKAAECIARGKEFKCDIGCMNQELFTYVACFGAFTGVTYKTPQELKNIFGYQAYVVEAVKYFSSIKPHKAVVTMDDEVIEAEFLYGMVSNSKSVAGMKSLPGINISLNDGYFEVTLVKNVTNPIQLSEIAQGLLFNNVKSDYLIRRKTKHFVLESKEEIDWVLDGEFGGKLTYADISILPEELSILVHYS